MTPQELLHKHGIELEDHAPGRHYALCPTCSKDRKKPGNKTAKCLGITVEADGSVRWGCNHCNWRGPEKGSGDKRQRDEWPSYVYRDRTGVDRFRKVRKPLPDGGKTFFLQHADGKGGWGKGVKGVDTTLLYRTDQLAKEIELGQTIAVVEGEKDADNLWRLGVAATCNAHGASELGRKSKWTAVHSAQLADADIVVFNDNDAAGYAHADAICRCSLGIAKRVRRLDLKNHWPEIPKGGDVSDWLAVGGEHTAAGLKMLIDAAPDYLPAEAGKTESEAAGKAETLDENAELTRLAQLSAFDYERTRKAAADALMVRAPILDKLVAGARRELGLVDDAARQGRAIVFSDPEPWPASVDGAELLDALTSTLARHIIMAGPARNLTALWVVHTYLLDCFLISPRLAVCSPVKRCGKTTLLDVLARLVLRPQAAASVTAAVTFRLIEMHRPTLLIDEADTFLKENEELRGVLNAGHRRGGTVLRSVGDHHEPHAFSVYGACAIALIGALPDTLADRSVTINLERRLASELIDAFRLDRTDHLDLLARQIARWSGDNAEAVRAADPPMPPGVLNRDADNLRPLLAIADAAGGAWPARARQAALDGRPGADEASRLELLLGDIRDVFDQEVATWIGSAELIEHLCKITPRPWAEYGRSGKPLTQNMLARLLKPVAIGPHRLEVSDDRARGYFRTHFDDAFGRYLAPQKQPEHACEAQKGVSKCPPVREPIKAGTSASFQSVREEKLRTGAKMQETLINIGLRTGGHFEGGNGGDEGTGLSIRAIDELADWLQALAAQLVGHPHVDTKLRHDLRERLIGQYRVYPEHVDVESSRVIEAAFKC